MADSIRFALLDISLCLTMIYFSFDKCRSLMIYICFNYIMLTVLYLRHCVLNNVEKRFQQVESNPVPMDSTSYALIIRLRAHFSIYNFFYKNISRINIVIISTNIKYFLSCELWSIEYLKYLYVSHQTIPKLKIKINSY